MQKILIGFLLCLTTSAFAQQPTPQQPAQQPAPPAARQGPPPMRPIPPPGVEVPATDRAELETGLQRLKAAIDRLGNHALLPDVLIYHEAVRYAL